MSTAPPVLEIRDLAVTLPAGGERTHAVAGVDLAVAPGEILCLVGESGSGKSVIAQGVMGLLPASLAVAGGLIRLQGEELRGAPERRLRELRARRMAMSERTFLRRFAAATGMAPKAWLQHERLTRARELLEGGTQSVERIAEQCGYRTVESFRVAFRNHLGVPPSAYRERFGQRGRAPQGR